MNSSNIGECSNCHATRAATNYRGRALCRVCYEANVPSWDRNNPELSDPDAETTRPVQGGLPLGDIPITQSQYAFFPVATHKFVVMSICTFGLYEMYWCFKNWQRIRQRSGEHLSPFWRALFAHLWGFSLFQRIRDSAHDQKITVDWSPGLLGTLYLLLGASWRLPDPLWLIGFASLIPMVAVLQTTQAIHKKEKASESTNTTYSGTNIAWIIIGGSLLILAIVGTVAPA
jgi:hypothetical protein